MVFANLHSTTKVMFFRYKQEIMKQLFMMASLQLLFINYSNAQNIGFNEKSMTKREISNVAAFAKVYGYVRHFYPSSEVENMKNWEKFICENMAHIENSSNVEDLQLKLSKAFLPYAPLLRINGKGSPNNEDLQGKYIVYRKNKGWGNRGENATRIQFLYTSNLVRIPSDSILPKDLLSPDKRLTKMVNDEITVSWPISVFSNDSFTIPHDYNFIADTSKYNYSSSDRYVRLGCIIEVWNVMQHFYPYMDDLKINNDQILDKYLQLASQAQNEQQFFGVLELLGAEYKDGHAAFMPYPSSKWADFVPPMRLEFIEGKLIVTYIENPDSVGISIGDEITSINNIAAKKWFQLKRVRVSAATNTWATFTSCKELLCGELNSDLTVKVKPQKGKLKTRILKRTLKVDVLEKKANSRPPINEYTPGYYYIDLCSINDSMLNSLERIILPNAKGIVFDFRGYPRTRVEKLFSHLNPDTMYSAIWQIPIFNYPDRDKLNTLMDTSGRWKVPPAQPRFTGNVVFIVDGRAISAAETEMGIVENYKLGKIIGEQTAGTNGNVNSFKIYGLYFFWFTGMKVLKHDGSRHHGVGIIPQIVVHKTIKDVKEGRDPFIDLAKKKLQ